MEIEEEAKINKDKLIELNQSLTKKNTTIKNDGETQLKLILNFTEKSEN